jgi:2-polyprenyl-3-methyl-5-hydroxy-6-metoxy-1,4-benzoquinol methylase
MQSVIGFLKSIYWFLSKWVADPRKSYLLFLKRQDKYFARLAARGMKWRGFAKDAIHPKHLFDHQTNTHLNPHLKPGIHFLDVGSGSGSVCIKALQEGAVRSIGIEYNPENIALTHSRANELGLQATILPLDLESASYPFDSSSFDLINCSDVLEHLDNRLGCLQELKRIKKPDAPIFISIPNTNTPWKKRLRQAERGHVF